MKNTIQKLILNKLLSKYENSRTYLSGPSGRRVLLSVAADPELRELYENVDEKEELLRSLEELKEKKLLDYSWVRFEKGNLVDRIWLNTEEEALLESSMLAGRSYGKQQAQKLSELIETAMVKVRDTKAGAETDIETDADTDANMNAGGPCHGSSDKSCRKPADETVFEESYEEQIKEKRRKINGFLEEMYRTLSEKKKIPRFFFQASEESRQKEAMQKNEKLLRLLCALALSRQDELERVLSVKLFGDSKYLEHELKSKLLSILRTIEKTYAAGGQQEPVNNQSESVQAQSGERISELLTDEQLLSEYGLVKWPEILEFCGNLSIELPEGCVDFSPFMSGACMNAHTLPLITGMQLKGVKRILTIENKANYTEYISRERKKEEMVIYHGGFLSPARRSFLRMLRESIGRSEDKTEFYHWGDIDLGGFLMLLLLRAWLRTEVKAFRMDRHTLEENMERCMKITDPGYLKRLDGLKENELSDSGMRETIDFMEKHRIRLEQEAEGNEGDGR